MTEGENVRQPADRGELPGYSVLMSVYAKDDPQHFITAAMSMLRQTVRPTQFVLVIDGPIPQQLDKAVKRVEKHAQKMGVDFTVCALQINGGLGRALDEGMKSCTQEIVARMDSDDISLPDRCARELACFVEHPHLAIMSGAIAEFHDDPRTIQAVRRVPLDQKSIVRQMRIRSPFNHPAVMYRKSAVIHAGGYGHSARKEDHDLFSRMLFGDHVQAMNIPDVVLLYRVDPANLKRRKSWKNMTSYFDVMRLNRRRGYVSMLDCMVVYVSQIVYFLLPERALNWFITTFLRRSA